MAAPDLLVVIDPVARAADGESVRIAKDVLCAGATGVKVCVPGHPAEAERALARRGSRRPVVVGDDRTLLRVVAMLHRERDLAGCPLGVVPVGSAAGTALARSLGVPGAAVDASRAVLAGAARARDLLVDDSGGVVLGGLRVPAVGGRGRGAAPGCEGEDDPAGGPGARRVPPLRGSVPFVRALGRRPLPQPLRGAGPWRLRVEADGALLADLDRPVAGVTVHPDGEGLAAVTVRRRAAADPVRARASTVTVYGPDFRYRADVLIGGPVRSRTWTALAAAWHLTLPPP